MPVESQQRKRERTAQIIQGLQKTYPDAHCELHFESPLQLLIATILSAQTTDKQVNVVTADLFKKYRTAADFSAAELPELERDLQRIGLFRNKAKSVKNCCAALVEKHGGEIPKRMEDLVELGGVGRKTANVVLGNAFNINEGVVVDTHVARLSNRLALTRETHPEKIEEALQLLVPREQWTMFSHWLIWHGRRRCLARKSDCPGCEINVLCPSAFKIEV